MVCTTSARSYGGTLHTDGTPITSAVSRVNCILQPSTCNSSALYLHVHRDRDSRQKPLASGRPGSRDFTPSAGFRGCGGQPPAGPAFHELMRFRNNKRPDNMMQCNASGHSKIGLQALLHNLTVLQHQLKMYSSSSSALRSGASGGSSSRASSGDGCDFLGRDMDIRDQSIMQLTADVPRAFRTDVSDVISSRLSSIKGDIRTFWEERRSPRQQIESVRKQQESTQGIIMSFEDTQECLRERILYLEKTSKEKDKALQRMKEDRLRSLEHGKSASCSTIPSTIPGSVDTAPITGFNFYDSPEANNDMIRTDIQLEQLRRAGKCSGVEQMVKIAEFWSNNNCDFHVNRILHSLRQVAAYEILEFTHSHLTNYLINHIIEQSREEPCKGRRGVYLKIFGLVEQEEYKPRGKGKGKGKGRGKGGGVNLLEQLASNQEPITENKCTNHRWWEGFTGHTDDDKENVYNITYADVLDIAQRQKKAGLKVKKGLLAALRAAEQGLLEEADEEGYDKDLIGDIRWQMLVFKDYEAKFSKLRYAYAGSGNSNMQNNGTTRMLNGYGEGQLHKPTSNLSTSVSCSFAAAAVVPSPEEAKDVVEDIIRTIDEAADLGCLDRAARLIRLGCYFLESQRVKKHLIQPGTAADELEELSIDLGSQSD